MFIDLKGRKCVVVGGGSVAERKIETLMGFDAEIIVISPRITGRILELKNAGLLRCLEKTYAEGDLEGAFLAVAATSDKTVNESICAEAATKNMFVNVADQPEKCTFVFPSVVKKGGLVVGITTSGSYPAMSKAIRKRVEKLLLPIDDSAVKILEKCRKRALAEVEDKDKRKMLLNRILNEVIFCNEECRCTRTCEEKNQSYGTDSFRSDRQEKIERIFREVLENEKID